MHILITAVGQRTEHWTSLFTALADRPDTRLTVCAADVSALTAEGLAGLAARRRNFRHYLLPHLISEARSGHMASVLFRPGSGRQLSSERPDIVHVIGEAAYLSTWQAIRLRDRYWPTVPITLYAAQNIVMRFPYPFPVLERRAYRAVAHAFPITPSALRVLRAKGYRNPATVVPLGVDTDRFTPGPQREPRPFTVGFVGRLEPHKGIADLLRAVELLDCNLLVVGDGSLRGLVEQAQRDHPGRVELRRWVDHGQLPALLRRMSVVALPSVEVVQRNVVPWIGIPLREQFGRVLIEAMACRVPVVGSDTGDIPHVIGAGGLVFPSGDPEALAESLRSIRDDPALARRLAANGLARAREEFAWHRIAETLTDIWERLAAAGARRRPPQDRGDSPADPPSSAEGEVK